MEFPEPRAASDEPIREPVIQVVGLTQGICTEGGINGTSAARLKIGAIGAYEPMTATEILSEIRAAQMPYRIVLLGSPETQPLASFIHRAQGLGYCIACIVDGSRPVAWMANLDELILMPPPPSSNRLPDMVGLSETLNLAKSGDTYTSVSIFIPVANEADYQFARNLYNEYPSECLYLAASGSVDLDTRGWPDRLLWLASRVIEDRWEHPKVIPYLQQSD